MKTKSLLLAVCLGLSMPLFAQHSGAGHAPYAGMKNRPIKSLSDKDINELRRGGGWGLALPAELNGMPGPSHVLEHKDQLGLNSAQVAEIQKLFDDMKKAAIPVGERLIAAEGAIEKAFESGSVEEVTLRRLLANAEAARTELRFIHLSQHYKTTPILNKDQIKAYNVLRGYAAEPCQNIPQGHDPEMYKKHMGCK